MEDWSDGYLWVLLSCHFYFLDCKYNLDNEDIVIPTVSDWNSSPSKQHGLGVSLKDYSIDPIESHLRKEKTKKL